MKVIIVWTVDYYLIQQLTNNNILFLFILAWRDPHVPSLSLSYETMASELDS